MRDVVVIGAGHNALVAACYLARSGLDVEVVERRDVVGGAVSTVERWPGYRVDVGSTVHILIRRTGIIEDLRLDAVGLRYLDLDPWGFAPHDGGHLTLWRNLERTCESIEALCGRADADAYERYVGEWAPRMRRVLTAFQERPASPKALRMMWGIGRGSDLSGPELARRFLQPADGLLDAHFSHERLKATLAWLGAQCGPPPHEVGTAPLVAWTTLLHEQPAGYAVGGSGALTAALAARLTSYGGHVRRGDAATRIDQHNGRVTAVRTASGDRIGAKVIVAGCHVLETLRLLGDDQLLRNTKQRVRIANGGGMVLRLATRRLPAYPNAPAEAHHAMQLLGGCRQALRAAYADFLTGSPPRQPAALVLTPSALDDSVAPAGAHMVTVWGQWYPYRLAGGRDWSELRQSATDALLEQVERAAPGFRETIDHVYVQTPVDLATELALEQGDVMHVEMELDGLFGLRPLPEWSSYRGPRRGLYLTGASTHPGGGVFGASGRTAAHVVLADQRHARRWRWR